MRDVVHKIGKAISTSAYLPDIEQMCEDGGFGRTFEFDHVTRVAGRSDLVRSDHIRPTYYHRYDMSFQTGPVIPAVINVSPKKTCKRFGFAPVDYRVWEGTTKGGRVGVSLNTACDAAFISNGTFRPIVGSSLINQAKANAFSNARDDVADLGETLTDVARTNKLLVARVANLGEALLAAKRRNWQAMRRHLGLSRTTLNDLPNRFLEYQFGWKPLVSDIISLVDDQAKAFKREGIITARGYAGDSVTSYGGYTTERGVEVGLIYKIDDATALGLSTYGLSNPLLTGWQAFRYTFLIDWILPVNDWLQALGGIKGTEFVSAYQTSFVKGSGNIRVNEFGGVTGDCSGKSFAMRRVKLNANTARPGVSLSPKFNIDRAASALALLAQRR